MKKYIEIIRIDETEFEISYNPKKGRILTSKIKISFFVTYFDEIPSDLKDYIQFFIPTGYVIEHRESEYEDDLTPESKRTMVEEEHLNIFLNEVANRIPDKVKIAEKLIDIKIEIRVSFEKLTGKGFEPYGDFEYFHCSYRDLLSTFTTIYDYMCIKHKCLPNNLTKLKFLTEINKIDPRNNQIRHGELLRALNKCKNYQVLPYSNIVKIQHSDRLNSVSLLVTIKNQFNPFRF